MDKIIVDIPKCAHCGKEHLDLETLRLEDPGEQQQTHEATCPDTGKAIPVWHSGF